MAAIVSPHIWYPSGYPGVAYDLRHVLAWSPASGTLTNIKFISDPSVVSVQVNTAAFEAAMQASVDAA